MENESLKLTLDKVQVQLDTSLDAQVNFSGPSYPEENKLFVPEMAKMTHKRAENSSVEVQFLIKK